MKLDLGGIGISDIPVASRFGLAYEFMLDHNYGLQIGLGYLGTPSYAWGRDSAKAMWRIHNKVSGMSFDLAFKHYFDNIDETTTYMSTFFSWSRAWLSNGQLTEDFTLQKIRVGVMFGYQKAFNNAYFDVSWGLGARFKSYQFDLQQIQPTTLPIVRPEANYWGLGWHLDADKRTVSLAMPIQFTVGIRY
jgi:hypothetical protein